MSQLDHALQAAHFAPETELGLTHHDAIGAELLRSIGVLSEIAALVEGHVREAVFEREPLFASLLRLRQWDERGKVPDLEVAPLASYREILIARVRMQRDA